MRTEWGDRTASRRVQGAAAVAPRPEGDLLAALAGKQAGRDRNLTQTTRRVVLTSMGVMEEQRAGRRRSRALAIAASLLALFALGPFVWRVTDDLIGGEHFADVATQMSLWICILCPAVLAAVLVAGWARGRK